MKTTITYSDKLNVPNENYNYSFAVDIDIQINLSNTLLTDEEYKKVTNAIKTIKRTLSPYREVAARNLRITPIVAKDKR